MSGQRIGVYFQRLIRRTEDGELTRPYIPYKKYPTDAGWDLFSSRDQLIRAGRPVNIHTDIEIAIPEGWYGHLTCRSSTLKRYGLVVYEGVIDQGYRGEMFIQVYNVKDKTILLKPGIRLAQLIFLPVPDVTWHEVNKLPESARSRHGFGSTGT